MNDIDFEKDQTHSISKTEDLSKLSEQVLKLKDMEDEVKTKEKDLKDLKKDLEKISGDVIPTMMTEMNISTLKLADGSAVEVKPVYSASISTDKKEEAFN